MEWGTSMDCRALGYLDSANPNACVVVAEREQLLFVVDDLSNLLRRNGLARCFHVLDEVLGVEVSLVVKLHANRMRFVT